MIFFEWWIVGKVKSWLSNRTFAKLLLKPRRLLWKIKASHRNSDIKTIQGLTSVGWILLPLCVFTIIMMIKKGRGLAGGQFWLSHPALRLTPRIYDLLNIKLLTGEAVWSWWLFWYLYERECEFIKKRRKNVAINLPILGLRLGLIMYEVNDYFRIY